MGLGDAHGRLRDALLSGREDPEALKILLALPHVAIAPALRRSDDVDLVRACVTEEVAKLATARGHAAEIAEALEDLDGLADERLTQRIKASAEARNQAGRSAQDDKTEFETAPNGAKLAKSEREGLDALLQTITYEKKRKN